MQWLDRMRPTSVAVVDLQGMIGPAVRPLEFARLLARLREDQSVRAVVLNIDSPGGTAVGSEMIARAVRRLRAEKPTAAFIGGIGASGGYMIAASCERIVALPSSIVGAIGVISYRPIVHEALDRLGVQMHVGKSGRLKDMSSPFREPTEEEREKEQRLLDSLYDLFVEGVASDRGLDSEHVRALATGEVYAAADAIERQLIDDTGDLDDVIDWAAEQAQTPRRVRLVRPRKGLRGLLLGRAATALIAGLLTELDSSLPPGGGYALYTGGRP